MDETPEKKAIVIVEDNEAIAELIKDTLNGEPDYQAVAVRDAALALDIIRSVKASLVLLDVNLPKIHTVLVKTPIAKAAAETLQRRAEQARRTPRA